jgi:hypothetical protein
MGRLAMRQQVSTTGASSRVPTLLVLCGWCLGMGVGVPAAKADIVPPPSGLPSGEGLLQVVVETDKDVYQLGEPVRVVQRITNMDQQFGIGWEFNDGSAFDLWVLRNETKVWSWKPLPAWIPEGSISLDPLESIEHQYTWDMTDYEGHTVAPGDYEIVGVISIGLGSGSTYITIVPEPCVGLFVSVGFVFLLRRNRRGP